MAAAAMATMATMATTSLSMAAIPPACSSSCSCSSFSAWLFPRTRSLTRSGFTSGSSRSRFGCSETKLFCSASTTSEGVGDTKEVRVRDSVVTTPFHLAIPVHDIHAAREFFGGVLGCPEGRSAKTWVDFNLFGHQVVCHEVRNYNASTSANAVDGDAVPVPHFGLAMSVPEFHILAERVRVAGVKFIIEPHIRFVGQPGEQWTMFFKDSSGNALEFKAMTTPSNLFAKYVVD